MHRAGNNGQYMVGRMLQDKLRQKRLATAGTKFTKPRTNHYFPLCMYRKVAAIYRVGLQVWQLGFADNTHITCGHGSGGILTRAKSNDDSNPTIMVSIDNAANANHVTL